MTDAELLAAHRDLKAALAVHRRFPTRPLGALAPAERATADRALDEQERAYDVVLAELRRRARPARLGAITLHLTKDADGWVTLDEAGRITPFPDGMRPGAMRHHLFDYTRPVSLLPARRGVAS